MPKCTCKKGVAKKCSSCRPKRGGQGTAAVKSGSKVGKSMMSATSRKLKPAKRGLKATSRKLNKTKKLTTKNRY